MGVGGGGLIFESRSRSGCGLEVVCRLSKGADCISACRDGEPSRECCHWMLSKSSSIIPMGMAWHVVAQLALSSPANRGSERHRGRGKGFQGLGSVFNASGKSSDTRLRDMYESSRNAIERRLDCVSFTERSVNTSQAESSDQIAESLRLFFIAISLSKNIRFVVAQII